MDIGTKRNITAIQSHGILSLEKKISAIILPRE